MFYITSPGVTERNARGHVEPEEGAVQLTEARTKGDIISCLIIRCFETTNLWSHCIPARGTDEEDYSAGLVSAAFLWLGHLGVMLTGDNELVL